MVIRCSRQTALPALGIEARSDARVCAKRKASAARAGPKEISVRKFTEGNSQQSDQSRHFKFHPLALLERGG